MKSVRIIIERSVKRKSCACVASKVYKELTCVFLMFYSESERAIERYDEWLRLREQAIQNWESTHPSLPLPERLQEPPPPRPEPYEDEPMVDVSVEMTADGFDPGESFTLDRSIGEEMVPVADPEVDKVLPISVSRGFFVLAVFSSFHVADCFFSQRRRQRKSWDKDRLLQVRHQVAVEEVGLHRN